MSIGALAGIKPGNLVGAVIDGDTGEGIDRHRVGAVFGAIGNGGLGDPTVLVDLAINLDGLLAKR